MAWRVHKFLSGQDYGFLINEEGTEVYFHIEVFNPGSFTATPVPPLQGELVEATVSETPRPNGKAPKAKRVVRLEAPEQLIGAVEAFNPKTGFGFIVGENGKSYYLHRSEVKDGRLPLPGKQTRFYVGAKQGDRPRACSVEITG